MNSKNDNDNDINDGNDVDKDNQNDDGVADDGTRVINMLVINMMIAYTNIFLETSFIWCRLVSAVMPIVCVVEPLSVWNYYAW